MGTTRTSRTLTKTLLIAVPIALVASACTSSSSGGSTSTPAAVGASAGASQSSSGGSQPSGGASQSSTQTVHIALAGDPSSLDPQAVEDGNALAIYDNVNEPLVFRTGDTNALEPGLALSWQQKTGTNAWEFKLRPNVSFSDGEPFNADAVVFSIQRITDPKYSTEQRDWLGDINGATKVDDLTVDITTSAPDPSVPERLSLIMMVPPKAAANADFATKPVGTGPYTMVSWTKGSKAVIKANPTYWGGPPPIGNADFQPISEPTVRLSSLKTGEINLVSDLLPEQMAQVPQAAKTKGLEYPTVILNTRSGPFKNQLVREAANLAVDKDALISKLYNGLGSVASCQIMGETTFGFDPSLKPYAFDVAKAKQLLAQAGDPHPSVTFVGDSSGRWLKDVELEQAIAGYLKAVGFNVTLKLADFSTYLSELFPKANSATVARPDMVFVSTDNVLGDADVTFSTYFQSIGAGASTSDTQLDGLVKNGRAELDQTKRLAMYQQANGLACNNSYFIFLMNLDNVYGLTKDLAWTPRYDAQILVRTMTLKSS